ncbi:hypothetical protein GCM10022204_21600 [Microlunatus aurantiacus]|uniref:SHOCT domain-containing protein n=1 Tax=Microlunatus aurantiacus TaxID=446786 RepID=A0ABP7DIZ7_9ACTN
MPVGRRGGRPGLIGTAARTAVVVGTANAVSNKQQARFGQQQAAAEQQAAAQAAAEQARLEAAAQQAVAQAAQASAPVSPPAAPPAAPAPAAAGAGDLLGQLQQLAQLQAAGVLTPEEFTAAKAKLLA